MAARYHRNTAILAKIEATYGTDATPTEAANALLVSNVSINPLNAQNVSRDLIRPFLGGMSSWSERPTSSCRLTSNWPAPERPVPPRPTARCCACGFAETLTASVRVEYNLVTPVNDSVSIYYFSDGVKHVARGCRGNVSIKMNVKERPVMSFKFLGLDGGVSAATPAALTLSGFKAPSVVNENNTGDVTFGATYTAATPTLTGGTGYPSQGLEIDPATRSTPRRCSAARRSTSRSASPRASCSSTSRLPRK